MRRIIVLLFIIVITSSCSIEKNESLTDQKLKEHLLSRKKKYVFHENNNSSSSRNEIPEPIYFETIEELDNFLDEIESAQGTGEPYHTLTELTPDNSGGITDSYYKDSRLIGLGSFINIGFSVKNCVGSNLNSWISGFTLGISYNHMGGTLNNSGNKIYYTAHGVMNYNIVLEGIGTFFSENVTYSGQYQCN